MEECIRVDPAEQFPREPEQMECRLMAGCLARAAGKARLPVLFRQACIIGQNLTSNDLFSINFTTIKYKWKCASLNMW